MEQTAAFEGERPRLRRLAARILADEVEAEDVVQQAWLRLHGTSQDVRDLPAWLTTVTTRLCLDRLRAKVPTPHDGTDLLDGDVDGSPDGPLGDEHGGGHGRDPVEAVVLADEVGVALQAVLNRLRPAERVAFVLHDGFGHDFATVATILGTTPAAARKLASRARAKVVQPVPEQPPADWEVVDAFLAAARGGDLGRLLELLAPDAVVLGDAVAVGLGTPERIVGRETVAAFFDGAAKAAFPMYVGRRPGAAWVHRGRARVAFDFTVVDGAVSRIDLRAEPVVLATVRPRRGGAAVDRDPPA